MLHIDAETADRAMTWPVLVAALRDGHRRAAPALDDMFVGVSGNGMLVRAAVIPGLGRCVKAMTIVAGECEANADAADHPRRGHLVRRYDRCGHGHDRRRRGNALEDRRRLGARCRSAGPPRCREPADGRRRHHGRAADTRPLRGATFATPDRHLEPQSRQGGGAGWPAGGFAADGRPSPTISTRR